MNHDMIQVLLTFAHYFVPFDMFRKLRNSTKMKNFFIFEYNEERKKNPTYKIGKSKNDGN